MFVILNKYVLHIVFTALLTAVCVASAAAADLPYLYQRFANPAYKTTLDNLFKGKQTVPWLQEYLRTKNGVDNPGQAITVAGKPYELYEVCQPHNCAGNFLYVLFVPGGRAATALLTVDGTDAQFFGAPDDDQKNALKAAAVKQ
jgi:hypothetical protein